jgi:hypothetical protein
LFTCFTVILRIAFSHFLIFTSDLLEGHRFRPAYDFDYVALDLLSVYPEDSGVYTCHARNAYGEAVSSATIKIFGESAVRLN